MIKNNAFLPILVTIFLSSACPADEPTAFWFDSPAENWENEGLPIGNGSLGAVVTGEIAREIIQFNEKTLWTGGPGSKEGYNFGWPDKSFPEKLKKIQREIDRAGELTPEKVAGQLGQNPIGYGNYQNFGHIVIHHHGIHKTSDYRRELNLATAEATVRFNAGNVRYTRRYFASYPDDVIAIQIDADQKHAVSLDVGLGTSDNRSADYRLDDNAITLSGALHDNGLQYSSRLKLINDGGSVTSRNNQLQVRDANSVTLFLAAGTNYSSHYPGYRGSDPVEPVTARINRANSFGISKLRERHHLDHQTLFNRTSLDLKGRAPEKPVNRMLAEYGKEAGADRYLESLYFQFGRYLLIASSRKGSLPANLQGVWNNSNTPPWNADYHVNINLQMNYWPAYPANILETAFPLFDFIDALIPPGEQSAKKIANARGWTLFLNTNIYGFTGLISWPTAFWQPEAGAWLSRLYYEHYLFTGDKAFLKSRAYPAMRGAALFWMDFLSESPDGNLWVNPSFSPEHGPFTAGTAMSQQIVAELFENTIEAAGIVDDQKFARQLLPYYEKLDKGLRIGNWGQLQEWTRDLDDPKNGHRHISHLFALHPANNISPGQTPKLAEAARVSLNARGDGGTGWSKAWKINMWARLWDGNHAHKLLSEQLKHSTLPNLWDTHPPFQIDGNFGATAGMSEMLLQSHLGEIHLLPALPDAWPEGSVRGLMARGNVEVDITWRESRLTNATLRPRINGVIKARTGLSCDDVELKVDGKSKAATCVDGVISISAGKSKQYRITTIEERQ